MVASVRFDNGQQNQTGAIMTQQYNSLVTASQMTCGIGSHTPAVFATGVSRLDCALAEYRTIGHRRFRLPAMWMVALVVMFVVLVASAVAQEPVIGTFPVPNQSRGLSLEGWIRGGSMESIVAIDRTMSFLAPVDTIGGVRQYSGKASNRVASRGSEYGGGLTLTYAINPRLDLRAGLGFTTRKASVDARDIDRYPATGRADTTVVDFAWSARSTQIISSIALQVHVPRSGIVISIGPTARISISDSEDVPTLTYRTPNVRGEKNPLFNTEVPMTEDQAHPRETATVQWSVTGSLGYELALTDRVSLAPRIMIDVGVTSWHKGTWTEGRTGGIGRDNTVTAIDEAPCNVAGSLGIMWRL